MQIIAVTRSDYPECAPGDGVAAVEERLLKNGFLVVKEAGHYVGLLTEHNVLECPHRLVGDCLRVVAPVPADSDLEAVLARMTAEHQAVLPVFRGNEFCGVVTQQQIAEHLAGFHGELQEAVERATARLSQAVRETNQSRLATLNMMEDAVEAKQRLETVNADLRREIAERKQAEEQLRQQAALLDAANDAIYVRALDHTVTYWNSGAERFYDWTRAEALGRKITELVGFDPAAFEAAQAALLERGSWSGELAKTGKTGKELVVFCRWTLLRDEQGRPTEVLAINTDITEQKKLEAQFLRAQRLEAVGTLASGIAHDLNNILTPILMAAPMLREVQTPEGKEHTVNLIESSAQRAADVVRQLLTFGRGMGGERITLHLKHLLRDLRNIIRETFPKNIRFTSSAAPDLWPLAADPTQLHQILLNLFINARDAMPEGGVLAVTAANFQADDYYASMTAGARPVAYVHLLVSDTGCGIRPEHLDKIFDPFFTTKEVGRGTGLGLATVQKVVTDHGGFVTVRSRVGQGTTFDVYLPASPGTMSPPEPAPPAPALAGQGELILVVDDEEAIIRITQETLLRHGYRAVTAGDGAEGVAVFARHREEVKAVITDLMMPVLDGLGLARVLAKMSPSLPVVVSTGMGSDPEQNERLAALRRLGVKAFLTKPCTAEKLLQTLHEVLLPRG